MDEIKQALEEIVKEMAAQREEGDGGSASGFPEVEVTVAPEDTGADFASNVAMRLTKILRKAPMEIAEEIRERMIAKGIKAEIEIAKPGFLNFISPDEYFYDKVREIAEKEGKCCENISWDEYSGKTIITEFSDPNPFKVLHVGHLYTSVVGDSISRMLEYAGAKVVRVNFGGDVGLHVGKTLFAVLEKGYTPDELTIEEIAACYVEGARAYEEDAAAKAKITELNKTIYRIAEMGRDESEALGGEEGELARLYWRGRELSYEYFKEFYARIGLQFDKFYPESTVVGKGLEEVKAHLGTTYEESDGAVVFRGEKIGLHTRVFINREGVPTYETKDVGLLFTKWQDFEFDQSIVITGNEQGDYMRVVLASVKEYAPELVNRTRHYTHGMVRLPGNKKMSSRKGNFLRAVDVLEIVRDELPKETDERIVLAAIKYAFLRYKLGSDIVFDPKESVSMTGNSGVYLLYSVVRAKKILKKAQGVVEKPVEKLSTKVVQPVENFAEEQRYERKLSKKIVQWSDVLSEAIEERAPYKVCAYLYELAQEFSRFYEHVKVAGSEREAERLVLLRAYVKVMEEGMGDVLGVVVMGDGDGGMPEEM